jgi:glycosyltransferase involved in cell wall biosynthesis
MIQLEIPMKVSVLVMTYNHAKFISKALDSVLSQQSSFNFEVLISEDCSTDGTREIVLDYQERFPDKIRLLLSVENLHSNAIVTRGIYASRGDYIALLDGDDYWTSPDKLQKQADFLDKHPECAMCFHNALGFYEDRKEEDRNWTAENQKPFSTLDDLWMGNYIATCSTMFRNRLFDKIPDWYDSFFPITDWPLYILIAEHGTIGYINEVMGAYRLHAGGLYSPYSDEQKQQKTIQFYKAINRNLKYRYNKTINIAVSCFFYDWAKEYYRRGETRHAIRCFHIFLTGKPYNNNIEFKKAMKLGLKLYLRSIADSLPASIK